MAHYKLLDRPVSVLAKELGERIEAFRLSQNLRQEDIVDATGLSRGTIVRVEAGKGGTIDSLIRILKALGVEGQLETLVPDAQLSPLERRQKHRQRARPSEPEVQSSSWTWGEE